MSSGPEKLSNLEKIGQLKAEASAQNEINGLMRTAENRLRDAQNASNSADSRFGLAYDAAHSLALAALRRVGYRPENKQRYIVFDLLPVTISFSIGSARFLHDCHQKRCVHLYDGDLMEDETFIAELISVTKDLHVTLRGLLSEK